MRPPLFFQTFLNIYFQPQLLFLCSSRARFAKRKKFEPLSAEVAATTQKQNKTRDCFSLRFLFSFFFFLPSKFTRRKWKLILFSLMIICLDGISIYSPPPFILSPHCQVEIFSLSPPVRVTDISNSISDEIYESKHHCFKRVEFQFEYIFQTWAWVGIELKTDS